METSEPALRGCCLACVGAAVDAGVALLAWIGAGADSDASAIRLVWIGSGFGVDVDAVQLRMSMRVQVPPDCGCRRGDGRLSGCGSRSDRGRSQIREPTWMRGPAGPRAPMRMQDSWWRARRGAVPPSRLPDCRYQRGCRIPDFRCRSACAGLVAEPMR